MTTDRKIAVAAALVAAIGALAAVMVVPEFRCWALHDGCSASNTPAAFAAVPAILGLTGFIAYSLLRRTKGNDNITLRIVEKVRSNAPELFADQLSTMSPATLSKTITLNVQLRQEVGDQDFQLLQAVIRNQFVTSLVVYGLCGFCFFVGVIIYFLLQPSAIVGQQLIFRADDGGQAIVTGTVEVVFHGDSRAASITDATHVTIPGIPSNEVGKSFTLLVNSADYEPLTSNGSQFTFSIEPISVPLKLKPFDPYAGSLFRGSEPLPGAHVSLYGLPCEAVTGNSGYFEFRDCPQSRRLQAAKLEVTLPSTASPCSNRFPLLPPPKLTAIKINSNCSEIDTGPMACPSCRPDFIEPDADKKPNVDHCRRDVKGELWSRLNPSRWRPRDNCTVMCHVQVLDHKAYIQPGNIIIPSPETCEQNDFKITADQFFNEQ